MKNLYLVGTTRCEHNSTAETAIRIFITGSCRECRRLKPVKIEKRRAKGRTHYARNKEKVLAKNAAYRANNPEKIKQIREAYKKKIKKC